MFGASLYHSVAKFLVGGVYATKFVLTVGTVKLITHSNEVGVLGIPDGHYGVNFFYQLLLLVIFEMHVPLGKTCLPCSVLD